MDVGNVSPRSCVKKCGCEEEPECHSIQDVRANGEMPFSIILVLCFIFLADLKFHEIFLSGLSFSRFFSCFSGVRDLATCGYSGILQRDVCHHHGS